MLEIDIITIFPGLFDAFLAESFVGAAREKGLARVEAHDLRAFAHDRHRSVDDSPYGGGPGMVMTPQPLVDAIEALAGAKGPSRRARVLCLTPQGRLLRQRQLARLAGELSPLVLVCGRYEGIDQRAIELAVDEEVSIGDYVLSGGEVPAMVLVEGLVRLLPGVLGNPASAADDSFAPKAGFGADLLEGPQYTRPPVFRGYAVPDVLRSGDHAALARWRRTQATERTKRRRPDLARTARLAGDDQEEDE